MKTRDRKIAKLALSHVQPLVKEPETAARYRSLARSTGSHLRNSGLMAMVAFLASRDEEAATIYLEHIRSSLEAAGAPLPPQVDRAERLVEHVAGVPLAEYMLLTRASLQVISWHRRMADVLLAEGVEEDLDSETGGVS